MRGLPAGTIFSYTTASHFFLTATKVDPQLQRKSFIDPAGPGRQQPKRVILLLRGPRPSIYIGNQWIWWNYLSLESRTLTKTNGFDENTWPWNHAPLNLTDFKLVGWKLIVFQRFSKGKSSFSFFLYGQGPAHRGMCGMCDDRILIDRIFGTI